LLDLVRESGLKSFPKEDMWDQLPAPGGGHWLCGRAAGERLDRLASEALRRAGIEGRAQLSTARRPIERLLVERFVTQGRPIDRKQVDRVIAAAGSWARSKCVDCIHFLPCHLMHSQQPQELKLGPVTFRNRSSFAERIRCALRAEKANALARGGLGRERKFWLDSISYYKAFKWFAEVLVPVSDEKTSAKMARRAVTSALDCLHLLLGASHSDEMEVGGPRITRDRRGTLTFSNEGLGASISIAGRGQVGYRDGWADALEREDVTQLLGLFDVAMEATIEPGAGRPLSRRFLDAAHWFGEAVREQNSPAAKIVKFVTALERMVMTDEREDIANTISTRIAALCAGVGEHQKWVDDVREVYDLRSKLVHGSMSPTDPRVRQGVWKCARIAEQTLSMALHWFRPEGLRFEDFSNKRLAKNFEVLVAHRDEWERKMAEREA